MSIIRRLFETTLGEPTQIDVIGIKLSPKEAKRAEKKREAKIAAAKKALGDKYLNVPFKKGEAVKELPPEIPRIGKARKAKTA